MQVVLAIAPVVVLRMAVYVGAHGRWTPHKQTRSRTTAPKPQNSRDLLRNLSREAWAYSDPTVAKSRFGMAAIA